jgi:two-component system chemotaxis sensor kinase CheA
VIERVNEACLLRVRDALLPIAEGAQMLGLQPRAELGSPGGFARDAGFVVVVEVGRMRFGLLVDGVLETEEIVVKPLSTKLEDLPVFSGTTILGDGAVALILDPSGMGRRLGAEAQRNATPVMLAPAAPVETTTLLVFRGLAGALKAIPLSLVSRLEELDGSEITWTGDQPVIPYRGRLMTLFPVDGAATIRTSGPQPAIILSDGRRSIGLLVGEIVDVVEEAVQVDLLPARPDLIGAAMVRGRATELVDIAPFLHLIDGDASWADRDPVAGPPSTVLLVDDRAFFRDMLSPVLKAAGFRVRTAKDAEEALHIMAVETIDTLVTDLDLPVRTGLELIEDLRRRSKTAELTVVALTSDPLPDDMRRARELGVFDVVAKFDRAGLLAALAEANARERRAA